MGKAYFESGSKDAFVKAILRAAKQGSKAADLSPDEVEAITEIAEGIWDELGGAKPSGYGVSSAQDWQPFKEKTDYKYMSGCTVAWRMTGIKQGTTDVAIGSYTISCTWQRVHIEHDKPECRCCFTVSCAGTWEKPHELGTDLQSPRCAVRHVLQ